MGNIKTVPEILLKASQAYPNNKVLYHKEDGRWVPVSYAKLAEKVSLFSKSLYSIGVRPGDRVALMLSNSPEWVIADLGSITIGAVDVPLYSTLSAEEAGHILLDSGAKYIVVSGEDQILKLREIAGGLPKLELVITVEDKIKPFEGKKSVTFSSLLKATAPDEGYDEARKDVKPETLASIIYTSGTTGTPKGVMLTHANFTANVEAILRRLKVYPADRHLSFLPLTHAFERMAGYYAQLAAGMSIYYAESVDTIPQNILEVKPTIMVSVPRLFEKMIARIKQRVEEAPAWRRKLFHWAMDVGQRFNDPAIKGKALPPLLSFQHAVADTLIFKKIQAGFGGQIRFFVSGGAPLGKDVSLFFRAVGLKVLEGYGLTETSPVIAVNPLEAPREGAVGPPLDNVEVMIADDGELLVKGASVFGGYYNNDAETKASFNSDGWFHTGDIAEIDDGYLKITDRKKDILVLSSGKKVAPQMLEALLLEDDYIAQTVVTGENRNFVSALIVPNFKKLENFLQSKGQRYKENEDMTASDDAKKFIEKRVEAMMGRFARFEQIKKIALLSKEFSMEGGELTPTLKVKRKVVAKKYSKEIDSLYDI